MLPDSKTKYSVPAPLPLSCSHNTRSLGGYPTSSHRITRDYCLLRSDAIANLSEQDRNYLLTYGLGCVIDLRSTWEISQNPSPFVNDAEIEYFAVPMLDGMASKGMQGALPDSMSEIYIELLQKSGADFVFAIRKILGHKGQVVLFHCTAGKDRTGVLAALLLLAAGVSPEAVLADYAVTEKNMKPVFDGMRAQFSAQYGADLPKSVFSSDPGELQKSLDWLTEHYQTAARYLTENGLTESELAALTEQITIPEE